MLPSANKENDKNVKLFAPEWHLSLSGVIRISPEFAGCNDYYN